jgi:hypothetical protein
VENMGKVHKNLDDFFEELEKEGSKDLKDAFKKYDAYTKDENQNHIYNNIFIPGLTKMYDSFKGELDKTFKKDDAKVYGKKKELKKAAIEGMKKFFESTSPEILKTVEGIKDENELYERLVKMYDEHTGADLQKGEGIDALIDSYSKDKKATVGHVKRTLHGMQATHAEGGLRYLQGKQINRHFGHYRTHKVAAHVAKEIESRPGYKVDKGEFAGHNLYQLLNVREGVMKGKYAKGTDLEQQGVSYEQPKK